MLLRLFLVFLLLVSCRNMSESPVSEPFREGHPVPLRHAKGFKAQVMPGGWTYLAVTQPWPGADRTYRYGLLPDSVPLVQMRGADSLDAIIPIPVRRIVLTSTTHIPALETLGEQEALIGFPGLSYISSPGMQQRISNGNIAELGANEQLNTERVLELRPDVVVGFGVSDAPRTYQAIQNAGIPVVFNGDWTEQTPLGKAEWIAFFGMLLGKTEAAQTAFREVENEYQRARELAATAPKMPKVLSGALYRDTWYLPGGESWAAHFLKDAHAQYLWADQAGTGSLALSLEAVLERASQADVWVAPSQYSSYSEMAEAESHYARIRAFDQKQVYSYASVKGPGGGLLYYELGPSRPDLILKDLIHHLHPGLLPYYEPVFFKPLSP